MAYRVAGKRIIRSFSTYSEAKKEAEIKVRELASGEQIIALSPREIADALAIHNALENFRSSTGHKLTAIQAVTGYLDALKLLPEGHNVADSIQSYLGTIAIIKRKLLSEAVKEFSDARILKSVAKQGKRSALNPVYVADTTRRLNQFAETFVGMMVADLAKTHIDAFVGAFAQLSAKSRNHLRTTLRMFLSWCVRRDYLTVNHRLLEAEGLQKETLEAPPIDFYRPHELRALLENSSGEMRVIIALQALAGLRLQEVLRLDWGEVFEIPAHVEVTTSKSKTRQRRLVKICPALERWLDSYRDMKGNVTNQSISQYTHALIKLRTLLKIPSRRNGLRHGFVTYHFALHQNENATAAIAGNTPGMIHGHYKGLATKLEAEKWFDVGLNFH